MPHDTTLIATLAAAFVLAFALGFVAIRLRLPPLVGYLLARVRHIAVKRVTEDFDAFSFHTPVARLQLADACINTPACAHKAPRAKE